MCQRECFGLEIDIGITEINEMIMNLNLELSACSRESCHSMYLEEDRGRVCLSLLQPRQLSRSLKAVDHSSWKESARVILELCVNNSVMSLTTFQAVIHLLTRSSWQYILP